LTTVVGSTVRAKVAARAVIRRGDQVGLVFDAEQVSLFDAVTGRAVRTARDDIPLSLIGARGDAARAEATPGEAASG
ncbi:MAG: hypothetical protein EBX72_12580, partial [Betaproteobacteria bacterium]|nr:hypothetical protein [Betaproteobacteria bacterium]